MSKVDQKVKRIIGGKIHNHNVDGANDFIKFICAQAFMQRVDVAWSIMTGRPIKLMKVTK